MTELLAADEKAYQIAGYQLYVSQICVMDPAQLHSRQAELEQAMQARLMQDELDAYVLMLTDLAKGQPALLRQQRHSARAADASGWRRQPQEEGLPWLTRYLSGEQI